MRITPLVRSRTVLLSLLVIAISSLSAYADDALQTYDIKAQPMDEALKTFAAQTEIQVAFSPDTVDGLMAAEVQGEFAPESALQNLIDDTGLGYEFASEKLIVVSAPQNKEGTDVVPGKSQPASSQVLMAQNQTSAQQAQMTNPSNMSDEENDSAIALEEIIVIGSTIRGVKNDSSPIFTFDREDIDASGFSTLPQFIQSLPQVFIGARTESSDILSASGGGNVSFATSVDLRGLGVGATLSLLNGHRLVPPGGSSFADVSMIPFGAVERIEVLADGASAIYGSDAIAGAVNFVLRDNFDGAETRVRYGNSTEGGGEEFQFGQIFGKSWNSGSALLSYEYYDRDRLEAKDRSFAEDALEPHWLLPEQERHSVFLMARQEKSDRIELFGDAFYSNRKGRSQTSNLLMTSQDGSFRTEQFGATIGATVDLGDTWQSELMGSYSRYELDSDSDLSSSGSLVNGTLFRSSAETSSFSIKFDGTLFQMPGGDVKAAIGGDFRNEDYVTNQSSTSGFISESDEGRDVAGIFGQVFIPVFGEANRRPGIERLEVNFSTRYEDYSDFGDTTDWKAGVLWSPVNGLNLRGSYGTSFRAPRFSELDESGARVQAFMFPFPDTGSPTGTSLWLWATGTNSSLQPETSTQWTAGLDIHPPSILDLKVSLTYFDIDYSDKIANPGGHPASAQDPSFQFLIDRMPDPDLMVYLMSLPFSGDFSCPDFTPGCVDPVDAEVFFDSRMRNMASVITNGIDLTVSYGLDSSMGQWGFTFSGTYLIKQEDQFYPTSSPISTLNKTGRPVDLKLRGGVSWTNGNGLSVNTFVNHLDSYQSTRVDPVEAVSSWTTVGLNVSHNTRDLRGLFGNTIFSINILNLFDTDPPFVRDTVQNVNFDGRNSSPLGRFISLNITKKW